MSSIKNILMTATFANRLYYFRKVPEKKKKKKTQKKNKVQEIYLFMDRDKDFEEFCSDQFVNNQGGVRCETNMH